MKRADIANVLEGIDAETVKDGTLHDLIKYLKSLGWSDTQIVELLEK